MYGHIDRWIGNEPLKALRRVGRKTVADRIGGNGVEIKHTKMMRDKKSYTGGEAESGCFIDGKIIMKKRKLLTIDLPKTIEAVSQIARQIANQ